ncbi:flocculation protein FLO11 [Thrips palmi]|uniref:Flocculation protein FLO11 n=1 Tax=Thrips palmi TaxID=161013 RepID=A0A6P9ACY6_THRPL|nr:flocculation protein FLO11 [Thrips palmi]
MTLHWWQHWFWITGRAPVVAVLLAACHVWCQQPQWGDPGLLRLAGPGDAAGLGPQPQPHWWTPLPVQAAVAPVALHALHVPVEAGMPAWYPWAPRRLLGFAGAGDGTPSPVAASEASESSSAAPAASAAAPVAVSYLTTLGPGPGLGAATASSSQPPASPASSSAASSSAPRPREPKAIGVLPVGVMPTVVRAVPTAGTPATRPPGTVTSVLEIVEELAEAATPSPSENTPTSPSPASAAENEAALQASSAEMPNDEPAKAVSASSAEAAEASPTEASEAASSSASPASATGTAPTRMQSMSLSTAGTAPASDVTLPAASANDSRTPGATATTKPDLSSTASPRLGSIRPEVAAHPGPPHSHRSAAAPLGSASSSAGNARQHRVDAMSLSSGGGLDAGSITGIVLGIVVFAGLVGTVSFILYRRRYLNKPQTLNDKCSNPDSSGYIDDSTFRENSEEMYSLDNDSFLNSLEAMTIQNYWTDTVKHTKL